MGRMGLSVSISDTDRQHAKAGTHKAIKSEKADDITVEAIRRFNSHYDSIAADISDERIRQILKWNGDGTLDIYKLLAILGEEVGECNKAALEGDLANLRTELIQVAAVAAKFVQLLDEDGGKS